MSNIKLSNQQVAEIALAEGTNAEIAERYGISGARVGQIKRKLNAHYVPQKRTPKPKVNAPAQDCECGCGDLAKPGKRFIKGHNNSNPEHNDSDVLRTTFANVKLEDHGYETPCWIFQGKRDTQSGYPLINVRRDGKISSTTRHRRVYEIVSGVTLKRSQHVHHKCHNGHLGCVNPAHLEANTDRDHIRHHTSRLTREAVSSLRERRGNGERVKDLAAEIGYHPTSLTNILRGRRWKDADTDT